MARILASIRKVSAMMPIEGKDRIALALIDGWQVIVQKDQFEVNGLCIYCEIDSVLPQKEEFAFLAKKNYRIKTMKMAGVVSQGICFPLSILPEGGYLEGQDVTEIMGVKQYEATMDIEKVVQEPKRKYPKFLMRMKWFRQLVLPKKQAKGFPEFISKTDETRIQNAPFYLQSKETWVVTEKIDGQSGTFFLKKKKDTFFKKNQYDFGVCSRNLRLWKEDNSSYWTVARKYDIENILRNMIGDKDFIAIQGECVGSNVQGNKYKVNEPDLYVFNIIIPQRRLDSESAKAQCWAYNLKFVPILDTNYCLPETMQEILDYAHGESKLHKTLREGLVFRSKDGKQSFKAVDPLFLLKHDE